MTDSAETDPTMPPPQKGGFPAWVIFIAVVLAVSFSVKIVIDSVSRAPGRVVATTMDALRDTAERTAQAVQDVFQVVPEVKVSSTVVQRQSSPIAELALIEREFPITNVWKGQWLRSKKEVVVSGTFLAKAGFDLEKQFQVLIDEGERKVEVYLPLPEVLSVALGDDIRLEGKSGLWNRVTDEDRTLVMNEFRRDARAHVEASDLLQEVQAEAEMRLREALPDGSWVTVITFETAQPNE